MEKLAIVIGPTAVGKTSLALEIASRIDAEIISGDSMQVYKGMDIGTAKISQAEMTLNGRYIPHHLIDILEPWEAYSVAKFQVEAKQKISEINARGKIPLIVGGTGLYIQAIIDPYEFVPNQADEEYRDKLFKLIDMHGKEYLHKMLNEIDEVSALNIHPNNIKRVVRALEVFHLTGKPISSNHKVKIGESSVYALAYVGLNMERKLLFKRIEQRVDAMIAGGLVDEVKSILAQPNMASQTALQALGYKEIVLYLKGELTLEQAVYKIKIETRHFSKRQLTWFKRDQRINWYDVTNNTNLKEFAEEIAKDISRTINISVE